MSGYLAGKRQQFMHAIDGMRWQLLQCFLQPRIRFEAVQASRAEQRIHDGGRTGSSRRTREGPVDSPKSNRSDLPFQRVIVRYQNSALCVANQRLPMTQRVPDRFGEWCLSRQTKDVAFQPLTELCKYW